MLLPENHWGLTTFAADMVRIIETVDSPWLRAPSSTWATSSSRTTCTRP
ncbi:MAG: hypothetical protein R2851_17790 [Caldilineaceae bacterium]